MYANKISILFPFAILMNLVPTSYSASLKWKELPYCAAKAANNSRYTKGLEVGDDFVVAVQIGGPSVPKNGEKN